jgi:hypothetical protein
MANDSRDVYEEPAGDLAQGDVIEIAPHAFFDPPLRCLSEASSGAVALKHVSVGDLQQRCQLAGECLPSRALLLNYDCEIAKPATKRLMICPLVAVSQLPSNDQGNARRNRIAHLFFLPRHRDELEDSVVVLNQITTIHRVLLSDVRRLATLAPLGRLSFYGQFVRWLTRWELRTISCPNCNVEFDPTLSLPVRSAKDP